MTVASAVADRAAQEAAFLAAVDEGLKSLDAGEGVPHDDVVAEVMRQRALRNRAA